MKTLYLILYLGVFSAALCPGRPPIPMQASITAVSDPIPRTQKNLFFALSCMTMILTSSSIPTTAADFSTRGERMFQANCSSCHAGGKNAIAKTRTLEKEALEKFLFLKSEEDISDFVKNSDVHRGALVFAGRMSDEEYKDVARFVFDQAMEGKW
jgi:cytochrome c6